MYTPIETLQELRHTISQSPAVLVYFSHDECNVCRILKPKIGELFQTRFPKAKLVYVDIKKSMEISGQESIFAVPTLIFYLEGKEFIRESRNVSLQALEQKIRRPYELLLGPNE